MVKNLYRVNVSITNINGLFGGFNDIHEGVSVVASTQVDASKEAHHYIKNKHKYLNKLPYCYNSEIEILIEGIKVI